MKNPADPRTRTPEENVAACERLEHMCATRRTEEALGKVPEHVGVPVHLLLLSRKLERAIWEHNQGCKAACGKTSNYPHVAQSRRCDLRRDCVDCPLEWLIDLDEPA
jgi:hypothetical protein